ncbi:MAG TPA: phosphoribosylformylglycinamidine cyclo-ligase [Actinomycetota bacterium]|nr:phosphoribosylformylglycinamidine cyclo-ligase [Actinomycetota bacterium]
MSDGAARGYEESGVRGQGDALAAVTEHLLPTFALPRGARVTTGFGAYASVIELAPDIAIALSTDGVGSKTLIASALDRYDTIGFDCVAMSVNDLLCVGARPLALVDYLGVNRLEDARAEAILGGLAAAAHEAGIAVPGGEVAQLPEIITPGDEAGFDLVGTAVGSVRPDAVIRGDTMAPGDALVGISSSGIHSNGLTLARRALLERAGLRLDEHVEALGRTVGEELLVPTIVYVAAIQSLWDAEIPTPGLAHITGEGLANLCRLNDRVGFVVDDVPEPQPIFHLIAEAGDIAPAEMYQVFNMGVGFVVVTPEDHVDDVLAIVGSRGLTARRIGHVTDEAGVLRLLQPGLVGGRGGLRRT